MTIAEGWRPCLETGSVLRAQLKVSRRRLIEMLIHSPDVLGAFVASMLAATGVTLWIGRKVGSP